MIGRLESAIKNVAQAERRSIHTMVPGKVVSYDAGSQTAKVEILVEKRLRDPETREVTFEAYPILPDVPVAFPSGGGMSVTFPLEPGDAVLVIFAERSIAEWKASASNTAQEPFDARQHDVADAIAIPGGVSPSRALSGASVDPSAMVLRTPTLKIGDSTAAQALALASAVESKLNSLITIYNAHTHAVPSLGTSAPPIAQQTLVSPGEFDSSVAKVTS